MDVVDSDVREAALQRLERSPWVLDSKKLLAAPDLSTVVGPGARSLAVPPGTMDGEGAVPQLTRPRPPPRSHVIDWDTLFVR